VIVYISIGNSDDRLTQAEWSQFAEEIRRSVVALAYQVHGSWFSRPEDPWQNACWCLEFRDGDTDLVERAKEAATDVRERFRQDSVAWAVAQTEFV
jgi:hypothetical protein